MAKQATKTVQADDLKTKDITTKPAPKKSAKAKPNGKGKFLILVGRLYLGEQNRLVAKREALPFDSQETAKAHAVSVFHDHYEHKYRVVPAAQ